MSSILYICNWTAAVFRPTLNGGQLDAIPAPTQRDRYFPRPYQATRDVNEEFPSGQWGRRNDLLIPYGARTLFYRVDDPSPQQGDTNLILWVFPGFLVFSQRDQQLGGRVSPD